MTSSCASPTAALGLTYLAEDVGGLVGDGDEILRILVGDGVVESVGGGHGADENQHDEAHAFLSVIGAVEEADAGAGEDEEAANVERRRRGAFGSRVKLGIFDKGFGEKQKQSSAAEADDRRKQEGLTDVGGLTPVDAAGAGSGVHELIGDADADDGADERVGTGGRQAEIPGAEVPDDGGDEQGEDHGESGFAADLQDQFDRQQRDDGEGDQAAGGEHAEEIPEAGPNDGDVRLERVRVDDRGHGVGGVVESVDELETERDQQGDAQQHEGQNRLIVHLEDAADLLYRDLQRCSVARGLGGGKSLHALIGTVERRDQAVFGVDDVEDNSQLDSSWDLKRAQPCAVNIGRLGGFMFLVYWCCRAFEVERQWLAL